MGSRAEEALEACFALEAEGRFEEAETRLRALLDEAGLPSVVRADALFALARRAMGRGAHVEGHAFLTQAIELTRSEVAPPEAEGMRAAMLLLRAHLLWNERRFDEADAVLRELIEFRTSTRSAEDLFLVRPLLDRARLAIARGVLASEIRELLVAPARLLLAALHTPDTAPAARLRHLLDSALVLGLDARCCWWMGDEGGLGEASDQCCKCLEAIVAAGKRLERCDFGPYEDRELPRYELTECALALAGAVAIGAPARRAEQEERVARIIALLEPDPALQPVRRTWFDAFWLARSTEGRGAPVHEALAALVARRALDEDTSAESWPALWAALVRAERATLADAGHLGAASWGMRLGQARPYALRHEVAPKT